ncbi:MAG: leucine-rich repeat protein, partial [Oscillospiraceae bacterium]|nr:leucine-rich repeat protein [Oscillospiraceae bacterium]
MSKLSKRITAMLLSGMLVIGSAPCSVFAASTDVDPGQTSEIAEEMFTEDTSEAPASTADLTEEASAEEEAQYYTVTLDANGGYFENEWDDSIGDYAQKAEVINKLVPVDGTVAAIPVFTDQEGQAMLFAGWSLERDGELVSQAEEGYVPVDSCVLYAVWQAEDVAIGEIGEQEVADEGTEQADSVQELEEVYAAEESADAVTSEENPVEEDEVTDFTEDTSDVPADAGETTESEDISGASASTGDITEEASGEEAEEVQYYTVTLNANGGYFENEWDDAIGDYAHQAEVVEKHIPVDGTVAAFPVFVDPDGRTMIFAGWSLERDGELVITGDEEYAPVDNCTLYAVWEVEDVTLGETGEQEADDEGTEQVDVIQESEEVDSTVEETITVQESPVEEDTAYEANTVPETENEQAIVADQGAVYVGGDVENTSEESFEVAVEQKEIQPELNESSYEEETIGEKASNGVVESGTCGDNLTWTLNDEGTLTISGTGKMTDYNNSSCIFKNYTVKRAIIEYGVSSIGKYAFRDCTSLTSIDIPDSITSIGEDAFWGCSALINIKIPNSVISMGSGVFGGCRKLTDVTISNSVKRLEDQAFDGCWNLTNVIIPDSVTSIGKYVFGNCNCLTSVTIPNSVTSIGGATFFQCSGLTSVTISKGVSTIQAEVFCNCSKLTSVFFCGPTPSFGKNVFFNVTATVYYPANDPTWTEAIRQNYGGNITWVPWNPENELISFGTCGANVTWILDKEGELTITGRGSMNDYEKESDKYAPWYDNKDNIKKVIIDNLVSSIGTDAFFGCNNLCEVSIGTGVNSIGSAAFKSCNNLEKITIPGNVSKIGLWAFSYCDKLKDVTIDNGVSIIGSQAFYLCSSLNSIVIPDSTTEFGNLTFYKCSSLKNVKIGNGSTKIGGSCFSRCTSLSDVVIGEKISTIESGVFSGCRSLKTIQLPETINKLESHAFYNCSYIKEIHFEGSAPSFATDTFEGVTATAYYPANDPTWTEDVRQNYGGN